MSSRPGILNLPRLLFLVFCLPLVIGIIAAHAPLSVESGEGIAGATLISDPEKSFVLNTALNAEGDPQYYRFSLQEGQVLYGTLMVPGPDSPLLDLIIISPGINTSGMVPASVEVPEGSGARVLLGEEPEQPSYEPFTPQPVYEIARFNITVPKDGDYYIAIVGPGSAKYGLAPGFREDFTATEWLLVPLSVIAIHLWEGQSPAMIFAPGIIIIGCGILAIVFYRKNQGTWGDPASMLILASGLLYFGGAAMTGLQIIHAALKTGYSSGIILTLVLITGPVILGIVAVRAALRPPHKEPSQRDVIVPALIGILGLLLWAGLVIGPLLALAASAIRFPGFLKRFG